ncbi:MAG: hypothetical protein SVY53_09530 [Chloroflexota bacterium]|nr:hypothetical protein [Chloroflexota bacterium]
MMAEKHKNQINWEAGPYRDQAEDISNDIFGVEFDFLSEDSKRKVKEWVLERLEGRVN